MSDVLLSFLTVLLYYRRHYPSDTEFIKKLDQDAFPNESQD